MRYLPALRFRGLSWAYDPIAMRLGRGDILSIRGFPSSLGCDSRLIFAEISGGSVLRRTDG